MRNLLLFLFIISINTVLAQHQLSGRIVNSETGAPLPYARINTPTVQTLTNIDGSFSIRFSADSVRVSISYVGYLSRQLQFDKTTEFVLIKMQPLAQKLEEVVIRDTRDQAKKIMKNAIARKDQNNPEKALKSYSYKNYTKFIIDNSGRPIQLQADSTSTEIETILNTGRAYLSEKVSEISYEKNKGHREQVAGIKTAGFREPVYNVLTLDANPFSLYSKDYQLFKTEYAGPLARDAFKNYSFKILDTTQTKRPAYVIYFKPKREQTVAGLEGILYLDTISYAIQEAKAQLLGNIKLEVHHRYRYFEKEKLWFPESQTTTIRPGRGGKEIAVFGGNISLGRVQGKNTILNRIFNRKTEENDLYLTSNSYNYNISFNSNFPEKRPVAEIRVIPGAGEQPDDFWKNNRQEPFGLRDQATAFKVDSIIRSRGIERKIEVKKALATGYYPVGFWDFKLGKFFKFNNYEGIRLGVGGRTNEHFSKKLSLGGYAVYGFKDRTWKYNLNSLFFLDKPTGTSLELGYTDDISEVGSFEYLTGVNDFSILEPRFVNISFFYNFKEYYAGLHHRLNSKLETELRLVRSDISQLRDYSFNPDGRSYRDYTLAQAKLSFLWRPFSRFLRTPEENILVEKKFPKVTGEINQAFSGIMGGDFTYTKFGLKIEHEIKRLDLSRTEFILEGDYAIGDVPLTHLFHAYPNNPNRDEIMRRFSVAGRNSFETMYYNEFFSDKLVMFHLRHQLRPFRISENFRPELVLIVRYAIGSMDHTERHEQVNFKTLEHGYTEAGLELNKIFSGFGLSAAYRLGAYQLPTFRENFSFKFTFQLQL